MFFKHYCSPQLLNRSSVPAKISVKRYFMMLLSILLVAVVRNICHYMQIYVWNLDPNPWNTGLRPAPPCLDDYIVLNRDVLLTLQFLQELLLLLLLGWLLDRGLCWACCAGVIRKRCKGNPGGELINVQVCQSWALAGVRWVLEHQVRGR